MQSVNKYERFIKEGISGAYILIGNSDKIINDELIFFAKSIICKNETSSFTPCNICESCKKADNMLNPDIVFFEKNDKDKYDVAGVEKFISEICMNSYGGKKVGIIFNGDELSEIIQNKLLKTIEEPPENTNLLIGTKSKDRLLDTVCSRCNIIRIYDQDNSINNNPHFEEIYNILKTGFFYEYRKCIKKNIKSSLDAKELLNFIREKTRNECKNHIVQAEEFVKINKKIIEIEEELALNVDYKQSLNSLYIWAIYGRN